MKTTINTTYPNTVSMSMHEYDHFVYMGGDREVYDKDTKKRLGVLEAGTEGEVRTKRGKMFMVLKFNKNL